MKYYIFFNMQLEEEEEIRRLRKELVPKAQPMPYFDRPFVPKRLETLFSNLHKQDIAIGMRMGGSKGQFWTYPIQNFILKK